MSNHLKRLNMPRTWKLKRKGIRFVIRPDAGKQLDLSLPLLPILRDILKVVGTAKEARFVINEGKILVNQTKAKRAQQTIGIFDTLSFGENNYRLSINQKNDLFLEEISAADAKLLTTKVIGKTLLKKGKLQLNLLNGYNVSVPKDEYTIGDSVVLSLPKMQVKSKKELKKGNKAFIFRGAHPGLTGIIEEVKDGGITLKADKKTISTLEEYAIAL